MANPLTNSNPDDKASTGMTAKDAAKLVKRPISEIVDDGKGGKKSVIKKVSVSADEVLSFKDYGSHVVVVTKDGQKFSSADE